MERERNASLIVEHVLDLLDTIVDIEGDSDLTTACEGMAALLRSLQPRPEPAGPGDLAHLAALAIREAGEQSAAWGSAWIRLESSHGEFMFELSQVGEAIRAAANSGVLR